MNNPGKVIQAESPPPHFRFPLPFDPVRLVAGALARWPLILAVSVLFAALGGFAGLQLNQKTYSITLSLLKRQVPQTVQSVEIGRAYQPNEFNVATLKATLIANEPIEKALAQTNSRLTLAQTRGRLETSQLKGSDIFYLTYHSPISRDDALAFVQAWAEQVNEYTKRLQQADARQMQEILRREVKSLEQSLAALNSEILAFSQEHEFLGAQVQVVAVLNQLNEVNLQLESAEAEKTAIADQIQKLTEELRRQSPYDAQLKTVREDIAALRADYTDENPLIRAKMQSMEFLQQKLREADDDETKPLEYYTGTPIGNQLFLNILTLRNQLIALDAKVANCLKQRESLNQQIKAFPAISSRYEEMQRHRESLFQSHTLLGHRLKETEIFESSAPGYWQVFQVPHARSIVVSSLIKKPLLLGIAGLLAGAGIALLFALIRSLGDRHRSPLDCAIQTGVTPFATLISDQDNRTVFRDVWLAHLANPLRSSRPMLIWCGSCAAEDEARFWQLVNEAARADGMPAPHVIDLESNDAAAASSPAVPVIFRASSIPAESGRARFQEVGFWMTVVSATRSSLHRSRREMQLLQTYLPPCDGMIVWQPKPRSAIAKAADFLSDLLTEKFAPKKEPATP